MSTWPEAFAFVGMAVVVVGGYAWMEVERVRALARVAEAASKAEIAKANRPSPSGEGT